MERRTYLRSLGVAGVTGMAGCLDRLGLSSDDSRTVLSPADNHPNDPDYPSHGDEFPSFSIPDPLAETTVSLDDFVGERPFLLTYFFTTCPDGVCPALLTRLRWVQDDAADRGYEDEIALLAFTFDPERDTPEVLREYAPTQGIDPDAENFHYLRPESYEEAETLMNETFGMSIQRVEDGDDEDEEDGADEGDGDGADDGHDGDEEHGDADGDDTDEHETDGDHEEDGEHDNHEDDEGHDDHDHGEYTFIHNARVTLVNEDGIVERAYPSAVQSERAVDQERLLEDVRTVVGVE